FGAAMDEPREGHDEEQREHGGEDRHRNRAGSVECSAAYHVVTRECMRWPTFEPYVAGLPKPYFARIACPSLEVTKATNAFATSAWPDSLSVAIGYWAITLY